MLHNTQANYLDRVIYSLLDAHTIQFGHKNNKLHHTLRLAASSVLRHGGYRDDEGDTEEDTETRHGHQIRED